MSTNKLELEDGLIQNFDKLKPQEAQIMRMYYGIGMVPHRFSISEISQDQGKPESAVKGTLYRARQKLKALQDPK